MEIRYRFLEERTSEDTVSERMTLVVVVVSRVKPQVSKNCLNWSITRMES